MEKWQKDKNNSLRAKANELRKQVSELTPDKLERGEHLALAVQVTNLAVEYERTLKGFT